MPHARRWWIPALLLTNLAAARPDMRLVDALKSGDVSAVPALLKEHVDVNTPEADGTTALHWAVHHDDAPTVEALIHAGADVKARNRYGVTALSLAATNGNARIAERLLQAGADPNEASAEGETPLMTAARAGSVEAAKVLLAHGARVNAKETWRGQTALMWAAAQDHPAMVRLLLAHGGDVHARSSAGFSPLVFAVRVGSLESVELLLAAGGSVNETAPDASSLLVVAIVNAQYDLARFLVEQGADPNASGPGWTPLHSAVRARHPDTVALPNPIPSGRLDNLGLIETLLWYGADVNARATKAVPGVFTFLKPVGATPFLLAAHAVDVPVMRLLVAYGADPLLPTSDRTTPLIAAAGIGYDEGRHTWWTESASLDAVKLAFELGGDVNAVDDAGNTALHGAALTGANSVVRFLVDKGARLDVVNKRGWLPVTIAEGIHLDALFKFRPETAALLRQLMSARAK